MISINQKDCFTSRKNLGIPDCIVEVGIPKGYIKIPKGWALDLTSGVFNKAYVDSQIQLGNFIPVLGAVEYTDGTPEPTTEEYQGGVKSVVRNGLPELSFKFIKGGWKYASALYSYNSQQAYDMLLVFSNGAIAGATNGTELTGFDLGMLNAGTFKFTDGNATNSVTVSMQLIDADQYNLNAAILTPDTLDFKPNTDLQPITDIVINASADVSDAKVYFEAKFEMNQSTPLGGIAVANIRSLINGVVDVVSAPLTYDSVTKKWSYTPTATLVVGDKVIVELYDALIPTNVTKIGTKFYKGISNEAIAVA